MKVLGWNTSTHVLLVPLQWSAPSHAPPCEVPVQDVDAAAKPSAGHDPLVPVQFSATSHCPADARHTVALDLKASTQVLFVPEQ